MDREGTVGPTRAASCPPSRITNYPVLNRTVRFSDILSDVRLTCQTDVICPVFKYAQLIK